MSILNAIFPATRPAIGMVHLRALPGAPRFGGSMAAVVDAAIADARTLSAAGFDGLIVENFGDAPFFPDRVPAETIAALSVAVDAVRAQCRRHASRQRRPAGQR